MVESSIPVLAFVLVNIVWSLTPALIVAVALGAGHRRRTGCCARQSVRHAINGLFGIGIGAAARLADRRAPRTSTCPASSHARLRRWPCSARWWSAGRSSAGSGRWWPTRAATRWRDDARPAPHLRLAHRALGDGLPGQGRGATCWVYFAAGLTDDEKASILGIMRIALGFPPYALLLALTVWAVRRVPAAVQPSRSPA